MNRIYAMCNAGKVNDFFRLLESNYFKLNWVKIKKFSFSLLGFFVFTSDMVFFKHVLTVFNVENVRAVVTVQFIVKYPKCMLKNNELMLFGILRKPVPIIIKSLFFRIYI